MTAAFIRRLTLTNFRSYRAAQLSLDLAGPVVLTGVNGAGKTNLIEAISMLAPGRQHRDRLDQIGLAGAVDAGEHHRAGQVERKLRGAIAAEIRERQAANESGGH